MKAVERFEPRKERQTEHLCGMVDKAGGQALIIRARPSGCRCTWHKISRMRRIASQLSEVWRNPWTRNWPAWHFDDKYRS